MPVKMPLLTLACTACSLALATPVPVTLCGAGEGVGIERQPLTDELRRQYEQQQANYPEELRTPLEDKKYRYKLNFVSWDGSHGAEVDFFSAHAYGHAYAHGNMVALSNSGEEGAPPAIACISGYVSVQENELPGDLSAYKLSCETDAGSPLRKPTLRWHKREGWSGSQGHVLLELGVAERNGCPLYWYYDAEKKEGAFRDGRGEDAEPPLRQNTRTQLCGLSLGELWAAGSSLPQPPDNTEPTPGADELPTTHEGAMNLLRVECLPLPGPDAASPDEPEAAADDTAPRFRYIVREACLHGKRLSFTSRYRYGQAYACSSLLLLSTSGAHDEYFDEAMSFIIVDLETGRALEDLMQLDSLTSEKVCSARMSVCWDGVDEQGNWCSGMYGLMRWHHAEAISGSARGISVRLGGNTPNESSLCWEYDAASGRTHLRKRSLIGLLEATPPHHCRELRLQGRDTPPAP